VRPGPPDFDLVSNPAIRLRRPIEDREPGPDSGERRHLRWLLHGPVRRDGLVLSWLDDARPGFPYLHTTALLLSHHVELLRRDSVDASVRHEITADAALLARALAAGLDADGRVVHRGLRYAFDTAVVTAALDRLRGLEPRFDVRTDAQRGGADAFLKLCLQEGRGQEGAADGVAAARWSLSFAPHLLKLAVAIEPARLRPLVSRFVAGYWRGGWFRSAPRREAPYAHAHAYALEGIAVLQDADLQVPEAVPAEGLRSLLAACEDPRTTTDVLAQTLRLAVVAGRTRDDADVARLLASLEARSMPGGGFRYTAAADSGLSIEATIVALQALRWLRLGAEPRALA